MIQDDNYVVIKGWMINRLKLKGTDLLLYALLYGFSQDGASEFKGTLAYLAAFAGVTENSAREHLKGMQAKGLIKISEHSGRTNSYAIIPDAEPEPEEAPKKTDRVEVREVLDYLNRRTGSRYLYSKTTATPIEARLNEGFTVADCQKVIDTKTEEWAGTDMQRYLRPSTLFGGKFQAYLNQKPKQAEKKPTEASYDLGEYTRQAIARAPRYKGKSK